MNRSSVGGLVAATTLVALTAVGCSSTPSNKSAGTTSSSTASTSTTAASSTTAPAAASSSTSPAGISPPCTHHAIAQAAIADSSLGSVNGVVNYGCDGSWAFANVTIGTGSAAFDAVIVLQAQGATWAVADRASACSNHLVPSAIYTKACTTS